MLSSKNFFFCFFLLISSILLSSSVVRSQSTPACGAVFDGDKPLVELNRQQDTTTLRVNWFGFFGGSVSTTAGSTGTTGTIQLLGSTGSTGTTGGVNAPGTYQIAIISEKLASKAINESGAEASDSKRCRSSSGLASKRTPDVMNFQTIAPDSVLLAQGVLVYTWTSDKLKLNKGTKYIVILKVSAGGKTVYTNSDGVVVGVGSGGSSDDDDEFPAYKAGLIAMGIAIFCLLLLLLLLLLLFVVFGKKEDKYQTTVHRNENVDKL